MFFSYPTFLNGTQIVLETEGVTEEIQIDNLHPGTDYTFTTIAENDKGNSSNQSIGYQVRTLEEGKRQIISHLKL